MRIGVPRETLPGETRIALVPDVARRLIQAHREVVIEAGAGRASLQEDDDYARAGARVVEDVPALNDVIVPGYGMAVAQAQHALAEFTSVLQQAGIRMRFAIHPVAGRMPGHMNVLLADANVPYDELFEPERINDDFPDSDVAMVVGANDVVNPTARGKQDSPLFGMPILDADKAHATIVLKRSLAPGFSGEDNPLFYNQNTMMVIGDANATLVELVQLLKKLAPAAQRHAA